MSLKGITGNDDDDDDLSEQQCNGPSLFFEAKVDRQAKMFGKQWVAGIRSSALNGHTSFTGFPTILYHFLAQFCLSRSHT